MNIEKELASHAKAIANVNNKYYSRFKHAIDCAFDAKARNYRSIDKITQDNLKLDKTIQDLEPAISITSSV